MVLETFDLQALRNVSIGLLAGGGAGALSSLATERRGAMERYAAKHIAALDKALAKTSFRTTGKAIAIGQLVAIVVSILLSVVLSPVESVLGIGAAIWLPGVILEDGRRKRVTAIEAQIDSFLSKMSNAVRVTPSVGDALRWVEQVLEGPLREEVERTNREMRLGQPLDGALLAMGERVGSSTLSTAITAILIGRRVGGDLARNLEALAASLREMARLEGVLRSKTAEGRAQLWVLAVVPFVLAFFIDKLSPGYFAPMVDTMMGGIVLAVAFLFWLAALLVAKKVLSVDM
jgi:tight adherence protein B